MNIFVGTLGHSCLPHLLVGHAHEPDEVLRSSFFQQQLPASLVARNTVYRDDNSLLGISVLHLGHAEQRPHKRLGHDLQPQVDRNSDGSGGKRDRWNSYRA